MSYRHISEKSDALDAVLRDVLQLSHQDAARISEALAELAEAIADQEIDRLFNRGDFRS
jgi:phage FluMu protein gp41